MIPTPVLVPNATLNAAARLTAIAVVDAPIWNWLPAVKTKPANVADTGFVPPANAAVDIAVGLVLVTAQLFANVPLLTADNITTVDEVLTVAMTPEVVLLKLTATAELTAVFVLVCPGATFPPTM